GAIGGNGASDIGLRFDAGEGNKADWYSFDWDAELLESDQNIEFKIRTADTLAGLAISAYVGYDGTDKTWFNLNNKAIHSSVADSRYAEIFVKLKSNTGIKSPTLHELRLNYRDYKVDTKITSLDQKQPNGITSVPLGKEASGNSMVLEASGIEEWAYATDLRAQFEVKRVSEAFDGNDLENGNTTIDGGKSIVVVGNMYDSSYHWRARVVDAQGRKSQWLNFGGNSEGSPPTIKADSDFYVKTIKAFIAESPLDELLKAPYGLRVALASANMGEKGVSIEWLAPPAEEAHHYNIYRGYYTITEVNRSGAMLLTSTTSTKHVDADKTKVGGRRYYYQVSAVDENGIESPFSVNALNEKVTMPSEAATWTSKGDFENNSSTTGNTVTINKLDTGISPGNVMLANERNLGTAAEGDLVVDGTTASYSTDGIKYDASNPFVIDGIHNYRNVVLQNNAVVTHSSASGGMDIFATGTFTIDSSSKIEVSGKGYAAQSGPGAVTGGGLLWARGAGHGGTGGRGVSRYGSDASGGPSYGVYDGSDSMQMGSGAKQAGGGRVKIVAKIVNINGQIQANGLEGRASGSGGGGGASGGGVMIISPLVNINGILSAAGGGGGASDPVSGSINRTGKPGLNGAGGNGANTGNNGGLVGAPPGNGGAANWCCGAGGYSAGGGGWGYSSIWVSEGGGGGAAGRIAIKYGQYNNALVNPSKDAAGTDISATSSFGDDGYAESIGGLVGPWAYYMNDVDTATSGTIGGTGSGEVGLQLDAGRKADWQSLEWSSEPLFAGQDIEFQIRTSDTLAGLDGANYVGADGTSNTWFNADNKDIPASVADSRFAEVSVKLSTNTGMSLILRDVTLSYDVAKAPIEELVQSKTSGANTQVPVGGAISQNKIRLEARGIRTPVASGDVYAEFELKPVTNAFDGKNLIRGSSVNSNIVNSTSFAEVGDLSMSVGYHWRARIIDAADNWTSDWKYFGKNSDGELPAIYADPDFYVNNNDIGPTTPGKPYTLSPTASNRPTWTWSASKDQLSGSKGYFAYLGTTPGGTDIVNAAFVTGSIFTYASDLPDGDYYLKVRAVSNAGNFSDYSENGKVTINSGFVDPLIISPYGLNVFLDGQRQINLNWKEPILGTVDHYNVYRYWKRIDNSNKKAAELIAQVDDTKFTDISAGNQTSYYYQVTAVNRSESGVSTIVLNDFYSGLNNKAVWTTDEDFKRNESTTMAQNETTRTYVSVGAGDVRISSDVNIGTGADGEYILEATKTIKEIYEIDFGYGAGNYDPATGAIPNFKNLTITNTGVLTTTPLVQVSFQVSDTLKIDINGSIDVSGMGYAGGADAGGYSPGNGKPTRAGSGSGPGGGTGGSWYWGNAGGGGGAGYGAQGGNGRGAYPAPGGSVYGALPEYPTFGSGGGGGY
ncbi:hypothetical protein LCGC14_1408150, partial [marine sediment metagenome]